MTPSLSTSIYERWKSLCWRYIGVVGVWDFGNLEKITGALLGVLQIVF